MDPGQVNERSSVGSRVLLWLHLVSGGLTAAQAMAHLHSSRTAHVLLTCDDASRDALDAVTQTGRNLLAGPEGTASQRPGP